MNFQKSRNFIFKGILSVQLMLLIDAVFLIFNLETSQVLSLIRYIFYFFGVYWIFKGLAETRQRVALFVNLFLIWNAYIILAALPELTNPMQNHLVLKQFISGKLFISVLPFLICSNVDTHLFKKIFKLSYYLILLYIIFAIPMCYTDMAFITIGQSEFITFLIEGAILMLFTLPYHRRKTITFATVAVVMAIVVMMLLARRNKVVFYGGGLGLAIMLNVLKGKLSAGKKIAIMLLTICGIVFVLNSGSIFKAFFEKMDTGMSSRENVIDDFYSDFNKTPADWIYGRGMFGEFDAGILNTNDNTGLRDGIENGYLYHILKGGGIWLGLFILISLNAMYKGFFRSRNIFVKGCALFLLLHFLDMVGFGIPVASLKYILVFLSLAVCLSYRWRNFTDEELKYKLQV